jgi:hypothetical protein
MERGNFPWVKRRSYNFTPPHLFVMTQEQLYLTLQAASNACSLCGADSIDLARVLIFWGAKSIYKRSQITLY